MKSEKNYKKLKMESGISSIKLIMAMDKNYLIGAKEKLPWKIPEEMFFFKEKTMNQVVIMGRKTFSSIGRPLPNRINIVLTRGGNKNYKPNTLDQLDESNKTSLYYVDSLEAVFEILKLYPKKDYYLIGGKKIYELFLENKLVDALLISVVEGEYQGDTYCNPYSYLKSCKDYIYNYNHFTLKKSEELVYE